MTKNEKTTKKKTNYELLSNVTQRQVSDLPRLHPSSLVAHSYFCKELRALGVGVASALPKQFPAAWSLVFLLELKQSLDCRGTTICLNLRTKGCQHRARCDVRLTTGPETHNQSTTNHDLSLLAFSVISNERPH